MNYAEAVSVLGGREHKKVANNTILHRLDESTIGLRLHNTDVLTFSPGSTVYRTGGWQTVTTKSRFNAFGADGVRIASDKRVWNVYREGEFVEPFVDGFEWNPDLDEEGGLAAGRAENAPPDGPMIMTPYDAVGMAEGFVECPDEETYIAAWQYLIDTGMAWTLQGSFGRTAVRLIESGVCRKAGE